MFLVFNIAVFTALKIPPQQGTSIRITVILLILFLLKFIYIWFCRLIILSSEKKVSNQCYQIILFFRRFDMEVLSDILKQCILLKDMNYKDIDNFLKVSNFIIKKYLRGSKDLAALNNL